MIGNIKIGYGTSLNSHPCKSFQVLQSKLIRNEMAFYFTIPAICQFKAMNP